ncbi:MAG: hypothetical protein MJZ69_01790 [Bacteroidaceae bacterium]|nr:hypothetical protein [Bacteroidaceae bacterium]
MKRIYYLLLPLLALSCKEDLETTVVSEGEVELTQIVANIATASNAQTRADNDPAPVYLEDHISRFRFVDKDRMTFTAVRRTVKPLDRFNYKDIAFESNSSGAWDRDKNTGSDGLNTGFHPVRIYWSDATSEHTFIGYSLPNVTGFDWDLDTDGTTYQGSIGNPTETTQINYNPETPEYDEITVEENKVEVKKPIPMSSLMRAEDLLLTYDTEIVAINSIAYIDFYHALSSVKVKVTLSDFYGSELDGYAIVDNMVLKHQPTLYKWTQTSYKTAAKSNTHSENNPRDMLLWDYIPNGTGENAGKSFTFYGITVPQDNGYVMQDLELTFKVKYPDPIKTDLTALKTSGTQPEHWITKDYTATISATSTPVYFHANQCTVINIKLNHKDETMTIGAQYTDWEFVPTPDEGELKKNSTFLQSAPAFSNRPTTKKVTIANDSEATEDDATWLYYKKNQDGSYVAGDDDGKVLLDIYGNTGTAAKPYTISTANQLLSLAYEVSNGGHSFEGKYIKLDAGIIMQKNTDSETVTWLGIGDDTHPFQGTFLGSGRKITRLKGAPLFNNVGNKALIDNVTIENPLIGEEKKSDGTANPNYGKYLTGNAALAQSNAGIICACRVNGDVGCTGSGAVGSLVGTNSGTIFACHHTGLVMGNGIVAGLVGSNTGSILFSYHAGELKGTTKYGIAPSGTIKDSYYDSKLATVTEVTGVTGVTTGDMQKKSFVNDVYTAEEAAAQNASKLIADVNSVNPGEDGYITTYEDGYTPVAEGDAKSTTNSLNGKMQSWVNALPATNPMQTHYATHRYVYQPAAYPKVE